MSFMNSDGLDDLARRLAEAVPPSLRRFRAGPGKQFQGGAAGPIGEARSGEPALNSMSRRPCWRGRRRRSLRWKRGSRTSKPSSRPRSLAALEEEVVARLVSTVLSRAPAGLAAPLVRVEVHLGPGLPAFAMVGLPEAVVRESRERVRSALLTSGFEFPAGRITVNLSPADLPKEGGRFDLPIAVGILAASGQLSAAHPRPARILRRARIERRAARDAEAVAGAHGRGSHATANWCCRPRTPLRRAGSPAHNVKLADHLLQVCEALRGGTVLRAATPLRARRSNGDAIRSCGRSWSIQCQARPGDRGSRRTWIADDRATGCGQDLARAAPAGVAAAARSRRSAGGGESRIGGGPQAHPGRPPAVSKSTAHRVGRSARSAAAPCGPVNSRSRIWGYCSSTSCRSSRATRSKRCANHWRAAWWYCRERSARANFPPGSS